MRWRSLVGSLALAGCLSAPPSGSDKDAGDDADPGEDGGEGNSFVLGGLAATDSISLDGRDELILVGRRNGAPVVLILYPGDADLSEATAVEIALSFQPVDITTTRWGATGIAVLLGPSGELVAIDQSGGLLELNLTEEDVPSSRTFRQLSVLDGERRLVLADDAEVLVSSPVGAGELGVAPIPIFPVVAATGPILLDGANAAGTFAIGVVESDREIDVYPFTGEPAPSVGPDPVLDIDIPDPLEQPLWRLSGGVMTLAGIDLDGPRLWYHSVVLNETLSDVGAILAGDYDVLHDLLNTGLNAGGQADLVILAEIAGLPQVVAYLDPIDGVPDTLPPALAFPLSGLEPPYWLQAFDVVLDETGQNEIIAYDAAGHLTCIDVVDLVLRVCGTLDLATLKESGASTSGRPGW